MGATRGASCLALPLLLAALAGLAPAPCDAARRGASLPPVVFVSRYPVVDDGGARTEGAIPGIGPLGRAAAVGGRLLVREPDGAIRVLVGNDTLFDVSDPCVSWDGRRIVFSGLAHPDSAWRLFTIEADGSGMAPLTRSDRNVALSPLGRAAARFARYDDLDPCWLPDGRVAFVTTRLPAISEGADLQSTNLFVVDADGTCLHRVTSERSGAEEPAVDPVTGRIVYARWWINRDRPSDVTRDGLTTLDQQAVATDIANFWQTVAVNPDGSRLKLHAGDPRSRDGSICYKPTLLPDGRVLAITAGNGALFPAPLRTGIRLFAPGADSGRSVIGLRLGHAPSEVGETLPACPPGPSALDPAVLPDGRLVISYLAGGRPDEDFGLYLTDLDGSPPESLYDLPGTHELDAFALAPRPIPPILPDQFESVSADLPPTEDPATFYVNDTFRFDCLNVFANAPVDAAIPDAPTIAQGVKIRFFMNFQRMSPAGRDPSILWRASDLTPRGAVHQEDVPAEVSMFEQLIGSDGHVLRTPSGKAAHVVGLNFARQGEGTKCIGCHSGHSVLPTPNSYAGAEWFNGSTSASVSASSEWAPEGGAGASPYRGARLVDRRARNDSLEVAWVAAGPDSASALLTWPIPVEVKELKLYGIRPNRREGTDLRVEKCGIFLLSHGKIVGQVTTGSILPEGTVVGTPPTVIDALRIDILKSRGRVRRQKLTGLAEAEAIVRLIDSVQGDGMREGTE